MKGCLLLVAAVSGAMALTVHAQVPATVTSESLVKAAKRAAGVDYAGTFLRICVAPDNLEGAPDRGGAPPARTVPDRKHLDESLTFVARSHVRYCAHDHC